MAWVVDTCMLIDVLEDDASFGESSARILDRKSGDGLVLCPVSYAELAPAFAGRRELQDEFLSAIGIDFETEWGWADTLAAHGAWARYVEKRRQRRVSKRPLADILIGAFALRHQGLLTRNPGDFRPFFPRLAFH